MELAKAKAITLEMIEKHCPEYGFRWNNKKRALGTCDYVDKKIELSRHTVRINDEEMIRDIIIHEVAHALTYGHHHDSVWRAKAIELGGSGTRRSENAKSVKGKYQFTCKDCGYVSYMYRKPKSTRVCCGRCNDKFDPDNLMEFKVVE
jgi:predicted SprT family Zn-dependent metalloprotease